MNPHPNHQPFPDDALYLEAELEAIRLRLARAECERALGEAIDTAIDGDEVPRRRGSIRDLRAMAAGLRAQELAARSEIEARLTAQRSNPSVCKLGMEALADEFDLSPSERLLLVACCAPALGTGVADRMVSSLSRTYCGAHSAADLVRVLGPSTIHEWLAVRRHFQPEGKLFKSGLLVLDPCRGPATSASIWQAEVQMPLSTFARIVGDPTIMSEAGTDDDEVER